MFYGDVVAGRDKSKQGRGAGGGGSRGVLREIDSRLEALDRELRGYQGLVDERARLLVARASLTGEQRVNSSSGARRISQDEVAAFLREHPGARAKVIADGLGVPLTNVSQHLYRGRRSRFESRGDGWYLREPGD
jgi:hypothetical protein